MNDPAHASRFVRNDERLNRFFVVARMDVRSNWDVAKGPCCGSWKTAPLGTSGEINIADDRRPRRLKSKAGPQDAWVPGTMHGASSAATPSKGGTTWS